MSHYCKTKTQYKHQDALISALAEIGGWTVEQIEVHDPAVHLVGYHGDIRPEVAHIIIRRANIGSASNDIGFVQGGDGVFTAIISEFDARRFNPAWMAKLRQSYAFHAVRIQQERRGRQVRREVLPSGHMKVHITGYR